MVLMLQVFSPFSFPSSSYLLFPLPLFPSICSPPSSPLLFPLPSSPSPSSCFHNPVNSKFPCPALCGGPGSCLCPTRQCLCGSAALCSDSGGGDHSWLRRQPGHCGKHHRRGEGLGSCHSRQERKCPGRWALVCCTLEPTGL